MNTSANIFPWLAFAALLTAGCVEQITTPTPPSPALTTAPSPSAPAEKVTGRLDPGLIQAVVRANFGRIRACYENGLRRNPQLEGTVDAGFVIDRDGSTKVATILKSTLEDREAVACILDVFTELHYPAPTGGIVTVSYPVVFSVGPIAP